MFKKNFRKVYFDQSHYERDFGKLLGVTEQKVGIYDTLNNYLLRKPIFVFYSHKQAFCYTKQIF